MSKRYDIKKKIFTLLIVSSSAIAGVCGGIAAALFYDLPQILSLSDFAPPTVTRIYSSDKIMLAELFSERRDYIPFHSIPDYLKKAVIATEDQNFYEHTGLDLKGIIRAIIKDIIAGGFVEGASTITQQLAKALFLSPEKKILRKAKEAILAFQLEKRYTKDEILELYLNQIYFGSGAYGAESAAKIFFGKPAKDLTLAESALIAGMPKAPSKYSPFINKKLAVKRKNTVLVQMRGLNMITLEEYADAVQSEPILAQKKTNNIKAPYFIAYIKKELKDRFGAYRLYNDGLTVYTTLSYEMQKAAEDAVKKGISDLKKRMTKHGLTSAEPEAALIAIDVETGSILAMVGGSDYFKTPYNRAVHAKRQPGSAFKPIIYALAVENGFSQNKILMDTPVSFIGKNKADKWEPSNFSKTYSGEITLRNSLIYSKNLPTIKLAQMLGTAFISDFAHKLGIKSKILPNLSTALGTSEVTLMELTSAYAVFPNKGKKTSPFGVKSITDRRRRNIFEQNFETEQVLTPQDAAITTDMLKGVINYGTGRKASVISNEIAGKTGTTNNYKDALFIGFSPGIAVGVRVGQDDCKTLGIGETGAKAALPIWMDFMKRALAILPYKYFDVPDGTSFVRVNKKTGNAAGEQDSDSIKILTKIRTD